MRYKYLFYKEKAKIMIIHCREDKFELLKYQGEDYYSGDLASFWEWWEKTSSFLASQHKVDFLFLTDDNRFYCEKEYSSVKESSWSLEEIISFLAQYTSYSKLKLKQAELDNDFKIKCNKLADKYRVEVENILYIRVFPQKSILKENNKNFEMELENIEQSRLSRYYEKKNKVIQEKKSRRQKKD